MYTETLEPSGKPLAAFFGAVGCVAALYALYRVMVRFAIPYSGVALFIGAALIAYFLLHRQLTLYRYTLENGVLYVERLTGKRAQTVAGIELALAERFCPYEKSLPRAEKFIATNRGFASAYALDFRVEGRKKLSRLMLHPSAELVSLISQEMAANSQVEKENK